MTGEHKSVTVTVIAGIGTGLPCQEKGVSIQRGIPAVPKSQTMNPVSAAGSDWSRTTEVFVRSNRSCLQLVPVFERLAHQVIHLKEGIYDRSLPVDGERIAGKVGVAGKGGDLCAGTGSDDGECGLQTNAAGDYRG